MNRVRNRGFTLIELTVVIIILAILAVFGYKNYATNKMESRRSEARSALIATEGIIERYLAENNKPNIDSTDLDLSQFSNYKSTSSTPAYSKEGYYRITIVPKSTGYTINATATVAGSLTDCDSPSNENVKQCNDTLCRVLIIDSGDRKSKDSSGTEASSAATQCW